MDRYNGILPVRKEAGMTSHDVINSLRRITGGKKIGHTGTLDPMASGLLLICLGRATKLTQFLTGWDKNYLAEITLGATSVTLDADGELTEGGPIPDLDETDIRAVLDRFVGTITQKVPAYSAVKVDGRELYKYARQGKDIETPHREVRIESLELKSFESGRIVVDVRCSKGTYIRALADDIGREIGCGGYLSSLERLRVGPFSVREALSLAEIEKRHSGGNLDENIVPIEQALDFPVISMRDSAREIISHGRVPAVTDIITWDANFRTGDLISISDESGRIMAIGKSNFDAAVLRSQEEMRDCFSYVRVLI